MASGIKLPYCQPLPFPKRRMSPFALSSGATHFSARTEGPKQRQTTLEPMIPWHFARCQTFSNQHVPNSADFHHRLQFDCSYYSPSWKAALMGCVARQGSQDLLGERVVYQSAITRHPTRYEYPAEGMYPRGNGVKGAWSTRTPCCCPDRYTARVINVEHDDMYHRRLS